MPPANFRKSDQLKNLDHEVPASAVFAPVMSSRGWLYDLIITIILHSHLIPPPNYSISLPFHTTTRGYVTHGKCIRLYRNAISTFVLMPLANTLITCLVHALLFHFNIDKKLLHYTIHTWPCNIYLDHILCKSKPMITGSFVTLLYVTPSELLPLPAH